MIRDEIEQAFIEWDIRWVSNCPVKIKQQGDEAISMWKLNNLLTLLREKIKKMGLSDEEIGDLIDLESEYQYPCSDGSEIITFDCHPIAKTQIDNIIKELGEL